MRWLVILWMGCQVSTRPLGPARIDGSVEDPPVVFDAAGESRIDAPPADHLTAPDMAGDPALPEPAADGPIGADAAVPDAAVPIDVRDAGADGPSATDAAPPDARDSSPPDTSPDAAPDGAAADCAAARLGARLGRSGFLVGGDMDDASFAQESFDWRAHYITNDVPEAGPCASCAVGCSVNGASCANGGCEWWGCWQADSLPPGRFAVDFIRQTENAGAIPFLTYYVWHYVAAETEGWLEVAALQDPTRLKPYLADWRFLCRRVAEATTGPVMIHAEPDLWGFGEQVNENPEAIPAAVSSAMAPECAGQPNTMGGLARCMLAIARAEAPNALVGLHASAWGPGANALQNSDPQFDLVGHAQTLAAFLSALGAAQGDFVVVEMSDRDAGEDGHWWDPADLTLPNFRQARDWAREVAAGLDLAPVWWQVPYGSAALPNVCMQFRDNRLDYVFDWPERSATDAVGVLFGGGAPCSTEPDTDGGHFLSRAAAHFADPPPAWCR